MVKGVTISFGCSDIGCGVNCSAVAEMGGERGQGGRGDAVAEMGGDAVVSLTWSGKGLPAVDDGEEVSEEGREDILVAKMTLSTAYKVRRKSYGLHTQMTLSTYTFICNPCG